MSGQNLIQIQNGSKAYGDKLLFQDVSFAINEFEHVGVVGPNGAGKTTLFKILVGKEDLDSGNYIKSNSLRLGYLAQEDEWSLDETLEEYLEKNCSLPLWEVKKLGLGLGLLDEHFDAKISTLSGGYRMRSQLLYVIGCEPNLMLLDEPTNYLDLESLLVLENFLINYQQAFLLISHDREFLRRVTDNTLEVESPDITKFSGGIDDYFEQKEMIREQIYRQNLTAQAKRTQIMDFVNRFRAKNTKAKQAQSKLKSLEKIKTVDIKPLPISAKIQIPKPVHTGKQVLDMKGISLGYGDKTILQDVSLQLNRGDHLGIVGINGAGKSTLLKGLAGLLEPQNGDISWGYGVKISYFAQHTADQLESSDRIYDALISEAHPDILPEDVLALAGALLFKKDDTEKEIRYLSGGEKTRVALGKILLKKSPFLILDEPTNHLDFATVEALAQALSKYEGSVIIVSHDRAFIDRVATKILQIKDGRVELYPGNYQEYLWSVQKGVLASDESQSEKPQDSEVKADSEKPKVDIKKERKRLKQEIQEVSKLISINEDQQSKKQEVLVNIVTQLNSATGKEASDLSIECDEINKTIHDLEDQWMDLAAQKENLESQLSEITFD